MISGCDSMLDISLVEDFLSFGIDLTQLNLVFNESTNPGWDGHGGKLEPPFFPVIKSENQSEDFEEIIGLTNESSSFEHFCSTKKVLRKTVTVKRLSRNSTESVSASRRKTAISRVEQMSGRDDPDIKLDEVENDQVDTGLDCSEEDPDFEVNSTATKRKYKKGKKLTEEIEDDKPPQKTISSE